MRVADDFRRIARLSLKGKWMVAILAGLVAMLLGVLSWEGTPEFSVEKNDAGVQATATVLGQTFYLGDIIQNPSTETFFAGVATYFMLLTLVVLAFQIILGGIVSAGYYKFNLDLVDGEEVGLKTLFAYFPHWKTMVIANLLITLYTAFWMMLFIIPGIIAAYRYSMTYYILAENPELNASDAIDRSKKLMDGNKYRKLCLDFSFFGWILLSVFTLGIGNLFLNPYMQAASAAFYRDITEVKVEEKREIPLLASVEPAQEG